jgi:hypothetical protein
VLPKDVVKRGRPTPGQDVQDSYIVQAHGANNPETIVKMLGIFRVFYNYCLVGQDKKTAAMRLRLAKGVVSLEDIIYFS